MGLPADIHPTFQGNAQAFQSSLSSQPWLILAALVTVYIVLGMLYESYIHPVTILSTLPSAGVGALLALLAFHTELTVIALIGIILLIGIVKKNAIMMIDFAIETERTGKTPEESIYQACLLRFRPIMMTTMAALFGGLPLALMTGTGSEMRRPLGISIVGGLMVSQALTLYTTPVIYLYMDRLQLRIKGRKHARMLRRPIHSSPGVRQVVAAHLSISSRTLEWHFTAQRGVAVGKFHTLQKAPAEAVAKHFFPGHTFFMSTYDLICIGAGPTGLACAIEAKRAGMRPLVIDKGCLCNSLYHYPVNMVFFTTPELLEIGDLPLTSAAEKPTRSEALKYYRKCAEHYDLDLRLGHRVERVEGADGKFSVHTRDEQGIPAQFAAKKIAVATGYYDLPNRLGIPGEDLPHVSHYYTEPHSFWRLNVVVIGGKNSAAEAALDLYRNGAKVTLVHRRAELGSTIKYWVRPDIENRIKAGQVRALFETEVKRIEEGRVVVSNHAGEIVIARGPGFCVDRIPSGL